jgi:hypothetical protein
MSRQEQVEYLAKLAHEANRAYCGFIGDESQASWEEAPTWQRESAQMGVESVLDNPDMTPDQSHAGWMAHKLADGWKYGEVKDAGKKEHPCMVPYSQLPITQRFKDYLFQCVVRAGMKV